MFVSNADGWIILSRSDTSTRSGMAGEISIRFDVAAAAAVAMQFVLIKLTNY